MVKGETRLAQYNGMFFRSLELLAKILGDSEFTANVYGKSLNLPNTDTQNYSADLR